MTTLTDAKLDEIEARRDSLRRDSIVIATSMDTPEDAQIAADYDTLIAALRASRTRERRLGSLLRRYHERVTAADSVLGGIIASRSYLNDAMSKLPHPTIGDEVSAALGEEGAS